MLYMCRKKNRKHLEENQDSIYSDKVYIKSYIIWGEKLTFNVYVKYGMHVKG